MRGRPPAGRVIALFASFALALTGVAFRLVVLHVRDAPTYEALAQAQRVRHIELPARRGAIYDRSMRELALSLPARAVYADTRLVADPVATASDIAPILEIPREELIGVLASDDPFVYLARRVDLSVAERVERLDVPGIGLLEESKRYYPGGTLAAQVLGFVGLDGTGLEGVELEYQDVLVGSPGSMVIEQDPDGLTIPQGTGGTTEPDRGSDLVLTIDAQLQYQSERLLAEAVRLNGARGGLVLILEPSSGEVLAMATAPGFDANAFVEADVAVRRNRSVTDVYEPGSVNKVITAAAALEEGVIGLRERLAVPDRYRVADRWFHDSHSHPTLPMTLTDVIAQSSNIGTIMTAERLGKERLDGYLRAFGFGRPTGIGLPGEADGILMQQDEWWGTSIGTIPIGQGIAVTPLQMASVFATIANDGVRVTPRLVRGTADEDGRLTSTPAPKRTPVVSPRTANLVSGMLARAVEAGTGKEAQVPGYWVAGKTGTARKPLEDQLGYSDQYVASFIGFAPAADPAIVVAAILDEPDTVYGGIAAAPLFREVTRFALAHLRVPTADPPLSPPSLIEG
ncbi:MAG: peptidoglycan D,D-transpeptidase FtsI family protein [Actinomycetota bacterium]